MAGQSSTKIDHRASLRGAKRLIKHISQERESGDLPDIELSTVKELMLYLIPLTTSNNVADELEEVCLAAIKHYKNENFKRYGKHLKQIIQIGKNL